MVMDSSNDSQDLPPNTMDYDDDDDDEAVDEAVRYTPTKYRDRDVFTGNGHPGHGHPGHGHPGHGHERGHVGDGDGFGPRDEDVEIDDDDDDDDSIHLGHNGADLLPSHSLRRYSRNHWHNLSVTDPDWRPPPHAACRRDWDDSAGFSEFSLGRSDVGGGGGSSDSGSRSSEEEEEEFESSWNGDYDSGEQVSGLGSGVGSSPSKTEEEEGGTYLTEEGRDRYVEEEEEDDNVKRGAKREDDDDGLNETYLTSLVIRDRDTPSSSASASTSGRHDDRKDRDGHDEEDEEDKEDEHRLVRYGQANERDDDKRKDNRKDKDKYTRKHKHNKNEPNQHEFHSSQRSGGTFTISYFDEEDEDFDVSEENYRQLPRGRDAPDATEELRLGTDKHDDKLGALALTTATASPTPSMAKTKKDPDEDLRADDANQLVLHRDDHPKRRLNARSGRTYEEEYLIATAENQLALPDVVVSPSSSEHLTPPKYNGYLHHFITVENRHKFLLLYTFLKQHTRAKILVYFSTTKSTQYYSKLLSRLKFDVVAIHNGMSKETFLDEYLRFSKRCDAGILCVPDFQGEEFSIPPTVQWVVQFEPPGNPSEYIFRIGRISSETQHHTQLGGNGRALLFLSPAEFAFLEYYRAAKVTIYEYQIPKLANVQKNYQRLIRKDEKLRKLAKEAYFAYLMSYASHEYRDVYNVHVLEEKEVAMAFGFVEVPSRGSGSGNAGGGGGDRDKNCNALVVRESGGDRDRERDGSGRSNRDRDRDRERERDRDRDRDRERRHRDKDRRDRSTEHRSHERSSSRNHRREKDKSNHSASDYYTEKRRQAILDKMWKPNKVPKAKDNSAWLPAQKSWRYADRHKDVMKLPSQRDRKGYGDYKPESIKLG